MFRAYVEAADGTRTLVREERGAANTDTPAWTLATVPMTPWAGQTVRIVFLAQDRGTASTVEAAVDDVRITRPVGPQVLAERQAGTERGSGTPRGLDLERAAVRGHEVARDREAQPRTARTRALHEPVEDVGEHGGIDARA